MGESWVAWPNMAMPETNSNRYKTAERLVSIKKAADARFGSLSHFVQFGMVGASGAVVNILVVTLASWGGLSPKLSIVLGIFVAMVTNFFLNRSITFRDAARANILIQFLSFVLSCSVGALVNGWVSFSLLDRFAWMNKWPQVASVFGILAGMLFNFLASRHFVFRREKPKDSKEVMTHDR